MKRRGRTIVAAVLGLVLSVGLVAHASGGQRPYEDVVRDLKSTDPSTRVAAMRALAAASYPESMAPIAALLTDPVDGIQLEAIDTLLSFVVVDRVVTKRRVALVVEVRDPQGAEAVYQAACRSRR